MKTIFDFLKEVSEEMGFNPWVDSSDVEPTRKVIEEAANRFAAQPKAKEHSGVDLNHLRMQIAFRLDDVTKTLNQSIRETKGITHWGNDKHMFSEHAIVVDPEELDEDMDELRSLVWTLLCCMDGDNPDFRPVYEDVDQNGGLSEFNPEKE
ncbi:hypothetical protein [Dyadobacter sp. CY312]|uniref:hypothetical protein n=1 Tax=Dyadobacter sp. CY312 TaxID=2907303 RepID=UPI001F247077|nr:hypothetical protein [Dyadobacter sp. CY312]MCE7039167.1 hypothetical protein [Dyadobacter sp. CY312]